MGNYTNVDVDDTLAACGHLTITLANALMGSIHLRSSGSACLKVASMSWQARTILFTALTNNTYTTVLNKLLAPTMSRMCKTLGHGTPACSVVVLSDTTMSKPCMEGMKEQASSHGSYHIHRHHLIKT